MRYRRPSVRTMLLTAAFSGIAAASLAFSRPIGVMVDGQSVASDVPPIATSDTKVYVSLRTLAEALGAEMVVNETSGDIYVVRGNQSLRLRVGDGRATLNGMPFTFHHAPFQVRGRVMVSLYAAARAFGVHATYDPRTAMIQVMTPGIGELPRAAATPTPDDAE